MTLVKITEFDPNYQGTVGDRDLIGYGIYSDKTDNKIGTIKDILVDEETGYFRYFAVEMGFWIFGKTILIPVEYCQIHFDEQQVFVEGLSKEQAENLPELDDSLQVDRDHEERVSAIYPPRSLNSLNAMDPLGNPVSPVVPYAPLTIGTLSTLTSPTTDPNRQAPNRDPEH